MENGDKENISEFEVKITEMLSVLFNFEGPYKKGNSKEIAGLNKEGKNGGIAQLGEHLLCKQGVNGSIPVISTTGLGIEPKNHGLIAQPVRAHA